MLQQPHYGRMVDGAINGMGHTLKTFEGMGSVLNPTRHPRTDTFMVVSFVPPFLYYLRGLQCIHVPL